MTFLVTEPGAEPVIVEGWFGAEPARVFRAWTDPDEVMKWFGHPQNRIASAEIDLRPGGAWRFTFPGADEKSFGFEGAYEDVSPHDRLVFSWRRFDADRSGASESGPFSRVEVAFSPKGAGTTVRLVHRALPDDARRNVGAGWGGAFENLEKVLG